MERDAADERSETDALYDDAPCGLLVTTPEGGILRANRTFCAWAERSADVLVGRRKLQDLFTIGGRIFHQTHWGPLMQIQGSVAEVKLELVLPDGRKLPTVWNAVRRVRGGITRHEVAVIIATDRHKYEQELLLARRQAEELLARNEETLTALQLAQQERDRLQALAEDRALFAEQMVAIVSHDLRNPLTVIKMSAHVLGLSVLSEKQQRALVQLVRSNQSAIRLIADLLDFSRRRLGGGLRVDLAPLDLHETVGQAVDDLRVAAPTHTLLHRKVGEGLSRGSADRLTQLIGNLVSNAVSYGLPGRPVVVTSAVTEDGCSVSVHNEGPAIPAMLLPHLFDPMTRGSSLGENKGGIGLGLFIVREIARAHGGEVGVESAERAGTTFSVRFARNEAASLPAPAPSETTGLSEATRQGRLDELAVSSVPDPTFDDIARLAADACDAPIALVTLVDRDRQWFKGRVGLQVTETPRAWAFCAHAILAPDEVFVVEDAATDPRFVSNPLVTGEPGIRFYAGAPLLTRSGAALGTVAVIDRQPRKLEASQRQLLQLLAQQVVQMLEQQAAE